MKTAIAAVMSVLLIGVLMLTMRQQTLSFNPTLRERISYACVPENVADYVDIQAYNADGKQIKFRFDFSAIDNKKSYIIIHHRGSVVKQVTGISFKQLPKAVKGKILQAKNKNVNLHKVKLTNGS